MSTNAQITELIRVAQERAATEVETWIPENVGDNIAGTVIELGSIATIYGTYATTTIETLDDGTTPKRTMRVAWMGAVLEAQYDRMQPRPGDIVAFHYQKDVEPKSGMQAYHLIVAVVIDVKTGMSKVPINLGIHVPTEAELTEADSITGELPSSSHAEFLARNTVDKPDLPQFTDDDMTLKPKTTKDKT